jgi:trimeric autotransporter adhesin
LFQDRTKSDLFFNFSSKIQKKSKFEIIDDQHLKNLNQLKSTPSKKQKQISTISLFENNGGNKSTSKAKGANVMAKNAKTPTSLASSSTVSLNKYADQITRHHNSINSNRSILMIKSSNATMNTTTMNTSINKKTENNAQKRPPLPQMPPIFQLQNHHLGAPSHKISTKNLEENIKQSFGNETEGESESFTNSNQNSQCFIYGMSNKAFSGDDLNQSSTEKQASCSTNNVESFVPSSFRPMSNQVSILNINKIEIKTDLSSTRPTSAIGMTCATMRSANASPKEEDTVTYHHPWKMCNDYEALEGTHTHTNTNTGTSGSLGNLSGVTTYSEVFSDSKMLDCLENRSFTSNSHRNILCSNNNELISRSSKITQELELRLKERRQMMESNTGKFYPKILQQSDLTQSLTIPHGRTSSASTHTTSSSSSSSSTSSSASESSNDSDQLIRKSTNSFGTGSSSASQLSMSCVCPCHSHSQTQNQAHSHSHSHIHVQSHNHQTTNKNLNSSSDLIISNSQKCNNTRHHHHHTVTNITNNLPSAIKAKKNESLSSTNSSTPSPPTKITPTNNTTRINVVTTTTTNANKYKNPKIVLDGSATLPTKRESIRMLMENKAVSENKQKSALEMHLNTLLGTRASTNNLNSLNE